MKEIVKILSFFILFPVLIYVIVFSISKYILHKRKKSLGIAADVTTLLLYLSVSLVYSIVFSENIGFILVVSSILIATIITYFEWRSKKEIEVIPLLRKIWRLFFLLLCVFYGFLWLFGVIRYVLQYIS